MKALYAERTGDTASHQRAIAARVAKLDERRQDILRRVLAGESYRTIGEAYGISAGSVQSSINKALEAVRKELAGEPRYNRTGRQARTSDGGPAAAAALPRQPPGGPTVTGRPARRKRRRPSNT